MECCFRRAVICWLIPIAIIILSNAALRKQQACLKHIYVNDYCTRCYNTTSLASIPSEKVCPRDDPEREEREDEVSAYLCCNGSDRCNMHLKPELIIEGNIIHKGLSRLLRPLS